MNTTVPCGCQWLAPGLFMGRHRHAEGYITVVLEGGYQEAGDHGRRQLSPGDVLLHSPFEAHLDRIGKHGAKVLNLPIPVGRSLPVVFRVDDVDEVVRIAERDREIAAAVLQVGLQPAPAMNDWPDQLAADLRQRPGLSLAEWARQQGLAQATLSRGFRAAYGVSPARYRREARTHHALEALRERGRPLAEVALMAGFSDQAHLSRAVRELTGLPPSAWRRGSNPFKTDGTRTS